MRGVAIGRYRCCHFQREAGRSGETVEEHPSRFGEIICQWTIVDHLELLHVTGFSVVETFWLSHPQAGFYAIKQDTPVGTLAQASPHYLAVQLVKGKRSGR